EFSGPAQPPKVGVLHHFAGHRGAAISPDSRTCVTCDDQGTLHLWNLSTLREIRQFKGHGGVAPAADGFTPDRRKIGPNGGATKRRMCGMSTAAPSWSRSK